jgi:hypothetical protein
MIDRYPREKPRRARIPEKTTCRPEANAKKEMEGSCNRRKAQELRARIAPPVLECDKALLKARFLKVI